MVGGIEEAVAQAKKLAGHGADEPAAAAHSAAEPQAVPEAATPAAS